MNKILKMIFHIALMAIVIVVIGYLLGLPMKKEEPIKLDFINIDLVKEIADYITR